MWLAIRNFISLHRFLRQIFIVVLALQLNCLAKVDLIIFSFDRPLQLYALLESLENVTGLGDVHIIYRASDGLGKHYLEIQNSFTYPTYKKQSKPFKDFKNLLLGSLRQLCNEYIMFAVDDILFTGNVDLQQCERLLRKTNAYGFYLRLGKNITHCYMRNKPDPVPTMQNVEDDVFLWKFNKGLYEWNYPHTVDCTVYNKREILHFFNNMNYSAPNSLESSWSRKKPMRSFGLCYDSSKIVNLPLNVVQQEWAQNSRHGDGYTIQFLSKLFQQGLKLDIQRLYDINNKTCHMEYQPSFIKR